MLRISLTLVDTEPLEFSEGVCLAGGVGGEDVVSLEPVRIAGRVCKDGPGYLVTGSLKAQGQLRCVRCLEVFPITLDDRFRVQLSPVALAPQQEETRLSRKELEVRFFSEPILDLEDLAAEQVELLLPMKPLCREDCQGLCPHCGANWNESRCGCPSERDERWQLAELFPFRQG